MKKRTEEQKEVRRLTADLESNYLLDKHSRDLKSVGIFYAPSGGSVHRVAKCIKRKLADRKPDMFCIALVTPEKWLDYRNIIIVCSSLGNSTWEEEQKNPWAQFIPGLRRINLDRRKVALVGLGDHVTYPNNFVDTLGDFSHIIAEIGGVLIGKTPVTDYTFVDSLALDKGVFVGLPLDEDFESDKTEQRVDRWLQVVKKEF